MDAMEAILTRRSIRAYTDDPVTDEQVETLLRAAMAAPSAGNSQAWAFVVIRDRELLDAVPAVHPYAKMTPQAPLAVLVCGDVSAEKYPGFWVQDCSAAVENLLLAAHAMGLGAVWTGIYPDESRVEGFRRLFSLPEHIVPLALVPLGFPKESKEVSDRYDPAKVKRERWS
ncbi:nitroreductase family protein [Oceanidesulfovibrio indonesiensis]|uniref:Nitroreductase family protein n=1 Tax=Oceanidesulfovibrio indonesiensis TaxID=54767 RepID=A0A7M3MCK4_9BACT|nr:nitroreductase family protein [Oceanidesulfovibrio indonesiensis]TVM15674.1 nitroreductase family protein [Oceanidesulfovibrio indonesiensis]